MSWQRYWLGALPPHSEFHACVHACLMGKPFENGNVRYQYDFAYFDAAHAGDPADNCCPVLLPQIGVGGGPPEAFIRRSKNSLDGVLFNGRGPEAVIGRSCDVAKTRFDNPSRTWFVVWRWREFIISGPQAPTITHISCRLTNESVIVLEPTLADSIFPQTGSETVETETIYDQLFTLAQAAGLPAPFPQSCLNPLP